MSTQAETSSKRNLKLPVTNAVRCHVHREPVVVDCKLNACVFHTTYPGVRNCILAYMSKQDLTSLKPIDIGMLKGLPASRVTRDLAKATTAMRNGTLRASNHTDLEPKFTTLPDLDVCYACEAPASLRNKKTGMEVRLTRSKARIWYCSPSCAEQHPPQYVAVELDCRTDIKTVSAWAVKKYSTLGGLEQALGMNRQLLGETLKRVLGIDAEELYSTTQRVRTRSKALVRRTGSRPEWLAQFSEVLKPLIQHFESKYGKVTVDCSSLSKEVQKVIDTI